MRRFLHGLLAALAALTAGSSGYLRANHPPICQRQQGEPQSPQQPQSRQAPGTNLPDDTKEALASLAKNLANKRTTRAAMANGSSPEAKVLDQEIQRLRWQFASLAADLDVQQFERPSAPKFDLEQELTQLVEPLVRTLKGATGDLREKTELDSRKESLDARHATARQAYERVEATRDALPIDSPARAEAERELAEEWSPLIRRLNDERLVVQANITRREDGKQSLVDTVTEKTQNFFKKSGLTLALAALAFAITYFGLRFLSRLLLRRARRQAFSVRLAEVSAHLLAVLLAIAATMLVAYARDDLLLLAIGIVFLVGAGWVVVKMAPQFFEQIRLVLNIGAVREGERILIEGLPYRVDALRFYSRLSNPHLSGGVLRVPIKDLIELRSRPIGEGEPWFPCEQGEVVELADGVLGRIERQTPEFVTLIEPHDAPRTYATTDFLAQNPRNLSHGFEIEIEFGIDYAHQQDCTNRIPNVLQTALHSGLAADPEVLEFRNARVEFATANSSSLDYAVLVEFGGEAAIEYPDLPRKINALLVETCTEHGFGIPFPQLQVHGVGSD